MTLHGGSTTISPQISNDLTSHAICHCRHCRHRGILKSPANGPYRLGQFARLYYDGSEIHLQLVNARLNDAFSPAKGLGEKSQIHTHSTLKCSRSVPEDFGPPPNLLSTEVHFAVAR